jgi:hypothetical protein|nr:hypothetical protein [uncultured Rhodopila sp.]
MSTNIASAGSPPDGRNSDLLRAIVPALDDRSKWGDIADDWQVIARDRRAFRLRGFSWFKAHVESNVSVLVRSIDRMEAELKLRPRWYGAPWPWEDDFASAQLFAAAKGAPLRFDKAAKALLVCELVAKDKGLPSEVVYRYMRIEPAIFRLLDFDADYLQAAEQHRPGILVQLGDSLGQPRKVFQKMMAGQTVSYRLAYRTREALIAAVPQHPPGRIVIGQGRSHRVTCVDEIIDGVSDPGASSEVTSEGTPLDPGKPAERAGYLDQDAERTNIKPPRPWDRPGKPLPPGDDPPAPEEPEGVET